MKKIIVVLVAITGFVFVAGYITIGQIREGERQTIVADRLKYPCWFTSLKKPPVHDVTQSNRQTRQSYGYHSNISIKDALDIFNEEEKCRSKKQNGVALTEDELIAAIILAPDYTNHGDDTIKSQSDIFDYILSNRRLPKGALLVNEATGTYPLPTGDSETGILKSKFGESMTVSGQRIYLFLNLHENPRESNSLKKEQIFIVKKTLHLDKE